MSTNLKTYQSRAVEQLVQKVKELLYTGGPGEVCVFQAPTGSGKTVMTAKFIEGLIRELPEDDGHVHSGEIVQIHKCCGMRV